MKQLDLRNSLWLLWFLFTILDFWILVLPLFELTGWYFTFKFIKWSTVISRYPGTNWNSCTGWFLSLVPPNFITKKKTAKQPITAFLSNRIYWNSSCDWLISNFLLGTEIGGYLAMSDPKDIRAWRQRKKHLENTSKNNPRYLWPLPLETPRDISDIWEQQS